MMKTINIKQLLEIANEENGKVFCDFSEKLISLNQVSFYNETIFAGCFCLSLEKTISILSDLKTFKIEGSK